MVLSFHAALSFAAEDFTLTKTVPVKFAQLAERELQEKARTLLYYQSGQRILEVEDLRENFQYRSYSRLDNTTSNTLRVVKKTQTSLPNGLVAIALTFSTKEDVEK